MLAAVFAVFVVGSFCRTANAGPPSPTVQLAPPVTGTLWRRLPRLARSGWGSQEQARQAPLALAYKDANETLYSRLSNQVNAISRQGGVVWLATRLGARRIETANDGVTPVRQRQFLPPDGLPEPGDIVAITADAADGAAWCIAQSPGTNDGEATAHLCRFDPKKNRWHTLRSLELPRPAYYPGNGYGARWLYAPRIGRGVPAVAATNRRVFFTLGVLGMPEAGPGTALLIYNKRERTWHGDAAWDAARDNSDHESPALPPVLRLPGARLSGLLEGDLSPRYLAVNALFVAPQRTGGTAAGATTPEADQVFLATSAGLFRLTIGGARPPRWRRFLSERAFLLAAADGEAAARQRGGGAALWLVGRPLPSNAHNGAERVAGGWQLTRFDTRTGEARDFSLPPSADLPRPPYYESEFDLLTSAPQSVAVSADGTVWVTAGTPARVAPGGRFWTLDPAVGRLRTFSAGIGFEAKRPAVRAWERVPDDVLLPLVARARERDELASLLTQEALDRFRDWFLVAPLSEDLIRTYWIGTKRIKEALGDPVGATWSFEKATKNAPAAFVRRDESPASNANKENGKDNSGEQRFPVPPPYPNAGDLHAHTLAATSGAIWAAGFIFHSAGSNGFLVCLERAGNKVHFFDSKQGLGSTPRTPIFRLVSDGDTIWAISGSNAFRFDAHAGRFEDVSETLGPHFPSEGGRPPVALLPALGDVVADFGTGGSRDDDAGSQSSGRGGSSAARGSARFVWALVSGSRTRDGQIYSGPPLPNPLALARYDIARAAWKVFTPPLPAGRRTPADGVRGTWLRVDSGAAYVATNAGFVLRFDKARETWRILLPPYLPQSTRYENDYGFDDVVRLTRDPHDPDALYFVNQEWVLRWKEQKGG